MVSRPVLCRNFVGRAVELEHLRARRKSAAESHGGLVLVGGEAGLGKSRLVSEFLETTFKSTARVARAECREFAQTPLGPIDDLLAALEPDAPKTRYDSAAERLNAMVAAFERIARKRTTVAVLEDVHWADPELLQTLSVLVARAASQRMLFVATHRDEIRAGHPNFVLIGKLVRDPATSVVTLGRLAAGDLSELFRSALEGHRDLSALALERIARRSDGNPLFAEELLRQAVDRGLQREDEGGVPQSLHAIVRERLASCDAAEQRWLAAAALCGQRFDLSVLAGVLGREAAESPETIARVCDLQLVVPIAEHPNAYAFRHALTRDAIYSEHAGSDTAPLHRKIGEALASSPNAGEYVSEIAYHFWKSDDRALAAPRCEAAGDRAREFAVFSEAVRWYERAAEAYGDAESDVARVLLSQGRALAALDQTQKAIEAYEESARIAQRAGDLPTLVRARKLTGGVLANDGKREAAITLLEKTLDQLAGNDALRSDLIVRLTQYISMRQNVLQTRRSLARIDPSQLDPLEHATADYYLARSTLHAREGATAEWDADFRTAIAAFEAQKTPPMFARTAHANFAWQALARGDLARARRHARTARELSSISASSANDVAIVLALVETAAGRYAEAGQWLGAIRPSPVLVSRVLHAHAAIGHAVALANEAQMRAHLNFDLLEEAVAADDPNGIVLLSCSFATALDALERRRERDALLERFVPAIVTTYVFTPSLLSVAALRPDLARPLAGLLETRGALDEHFHRGARALFEAELAAAAGDGERATTAGGAAARDFDEIAWPALAARAIHLTGNVRDAAERYRAIGHVGALQRLGRVALERPQRREHDVLTERQRELAKLIAAGHGNRAAAAALSVTEKTVERHLTLIYAKLGVTSRAQLAAYVAASEAAGNAARNS